MARLQDTLVDYGAAAADYGQFRQGFPVEFFHRLVRMQVGLTGQRLLDVGTGTGLLARDFARRGCRVTGIDPSPALLAIAEGANVREVVRPKYLLGRAEATGLPDASFEVVSAGTCWHQFDRAAAAREARRVLLPNGRLLVAHLDWHTAPGTVGAATSRLLDRHTMSLPPSTRPLTFLYPEWAYEFTAAGFSTWESFGFIATLTYTPEAWRGRVRASHRVAPMMQADQVARFDSALARMLTRQFPGRVLSVHHQVFGVVAW
jgi:SAM-dependent methyltransferase